MSKICKKKNTAVLSTYIYIYMRVLKLNRTLSIVWARTKYTVAVNTRRNEQNNIINDTFTFDKESFYDIPRR